MTFTVASTFNRAANKENYVTVDIPLAEVREIVEHHLSRMDYDEREEYLQAFEQSPVPDDMVNLSEALDKASDALLTCLNCL